jgi:proprotein convertase subtilisin/kexin type 5
LSAPSYGTCQSDCTTNPLYTYYDLNQFRCITNCNGNLVLQPGSTNCTKCPNLSYKNTSDSSGSCVSSCPSGYYGDNSTNWCVACDNNCKTCNDQYAENCSSCKSATYWFVSICVGANKCPNGTYANSYGSASSAPVCTICSVNLNCYTCYYNTTSSALLCSSCKVGYYINTTTGVCSSSCPSNYFASVASSSCIQCDASCLTCSSITNYACVTCPVNINVLQNSTGTYCLATCPTQYYYNNGSNYCKQCYSSCITCSGGGISSKILILYRLFILCE